MATSGVATAGGPLVGPAFEPVTAGGALVTAAPAPLDVEVKVVEIVVSERMEPVTVA